MAYSTKTETLTNEWIEIGTSNTTTMQIQMKGGKSAIIWIGENPPENPEDGFSLSSAGQQSLNLSGLSGEKVYARAQSHNSKITVFKN